jgi:hypothetical protein
MQRLFCNGPNKDFVREVFERPAARRQKLNIAAPHFFDYAAPVLSVAELGKQQNSSMAYGRLSIVGRIHRKQL